ncbi:GGDEF domain-containing protein [Maritalea porphyrae]|uniref:diguanylate cyclase n=2 Tax=Alphaproteobacteria TaxID=28211 RepID=A0ABQ5URV6_9HYPH|nr:GGDEF domain-containing protein [Maritalea porphyrae]GLQ17402.1 GGDEF domain-containing protein [Maritalea porphyrae]
MSKNVDTQKATTRDFSIILGAVRVMVSAVILAEICVFSIYSFLDPSALPRGMTVTFFVATAVAFPIGYYIHNQNAKLRKLSRQLAIIASTDQMSGLLNRTAFLEAVKEALHTPKSGPTAGSFLFIDVDHFKKLNDDFGHSVGDEAIKAIADAIKATPEEKALVGRIGGEEFGMFLPYANKKKAKIVAESIRRKVRKLVYEKGEHRHQLSISVGGALHQAGQSLSDFVQRADECMYLAKSQGRNRVVFEKTNQPQIPENEIRQTA